ncbi:hypothetical protein [Nocardia gipuzkoensis]
MATGRSQARELTNKSLILIAFFVAAAGAAMLLVSTLMPSGWIQLSAFVSQFGGLLLATALVTFAWEQWGRRTFAHELMAMANLSAELKHSRPD